MFVFSLKANKPKIIIALCLFLVVITVAVLLLNFRDKPVVNDGGISFKASNAEERITFLSQFGWEINTEPVEVTEVLIPSEFNETYNTYNELQKKQNLNLEIYKGVRAKKWVYEIKNYPGYSADSGCIRATLLVYDNLVIGGDVSSIEVNGFMQGFEYPQAVTTTAISSTSAEAEPK